MATEHTSDNWTQITFNETLTLAPFVKPDSTVFS